MAETEETARPAAPGARGGVARWGQFMLGMLAFATAVALMIRSGLGLGPWDAFHVGLHRLTGISVGTASILTGAGVVALSWRLGIRPAVGTIVNMVAIGLFIDAVLPWVPAAEHWYSGVAYYAAGLVVAGFGTGLYIAPGLGKGPRDGLMVGLAERSRWPVWRMRTAIEMAALLLGWLMGGPVGVGTLIFTFGIGPAVEWGMGLFGVLPPGTPPAWQGVAVAPIGEGAANPG